MKALRLDCLFVFIMTIVQLPHGNAKLAGMAGDINIAGLFEINNKEGGQCGSINIDSVMTFEATRWYIEQLNLRNALPFKLGFHGYKTCGLPDIAVDTVLNIIGCQWTRNTTQPEDFIVGLIGPATNEEAVSVATVLSSTTEENRFLQISPSATAATLGDRTLYPNFYRVIPGDATQIKTILLLMEELSWNRIAILFEDNTYCRSNANSLHDQAEDNHICVSKNLAISINEGGDVSLDQINTVLDQIMLHAPVVGGVILFAGKETANKVLFAMDKKGVDKVPLFILSETAGHTIDVFQSSGTILTKTKGSMSVSSPYTVISPFSDYWLSLVTDMVLFKEKTVFNPWLNDIFESIMGCNPGETNSCQALSTEQARSQFPVQPLQVKYGILAAHTMAKASLHMYEDNCVGPFTVEHCLAELRGKFKPGMMIEQMKNISIDFGTDFHQTVVVEPLAFSQFRMTFRDQAEPFLETDQEMYQVYNFQQISSNDNNDFDLVKVGSLLDNKLKLDIDAIRDYDSNGQESMFPDLRIGQCPVDQECTECIKPDIEDSYLHIPGDLYVIAIAPINDKALPGPIGCGTVRARNGFQVALALQFGVTWFNTHSDYLVYRNKFGGKKIGLIIINSCNNELTITRKILDLLRGAGPAKTVDLSNRILGFIGGLYTSVSLPLASILSKTGHVQVSYASTNPVLSDKTTYPYFLRIVTPDNVQAEAMMEVVKALRGEYVQIVYNEGAYGAGGRDSVIASAQARGICVAQIIEVQETEVYYIYYELIRRKPHAKIVIIFLNSHVVRDFMKDLNQFMTKGEFQFIGSEAWGKNVDLLQYDITKGALTVTLEMDPIRGLTSFVQEQLPKKNNADHPWLQQYVQKRHDCYFNWSYDKTFSEDCTDDILSGAENNQFHTDSWCEFATTAVFSLLMGSAEFFSKSCGNTAKLCQDFVDNPDELVAEMHQISMDIYGTGEIQIFDKVGDGNMGYQIYNIKGDPQNSDTLMYAKVGRFNLKTGLEINPSNVEYPTREELISSCPNVQACQNCFVTEPAPEPESSKGSSYVASIVLGVFVGIFGIATIILVVIIILMKRNSTSEDPYITPSADYIRPDTLGKSESPYHTDEVIQETRY